MQTIDLFPATARVDVQGRLWLGGRSAPSLAQEFGTPLYVFDETDLRARCRAYRQALQAHYPGPGRVAYASKAYLNLALAQLMAQEGLDLDVVSGGELYVARQAGFPAGRIHFHGNNKSPAELRAALEAGIGRIVVDNEHELAMLAKLAAGRDRPLPIWLRLSPDVDAHTHHHRKTGVLDSKFGFPLPTGQAEQALVQALDNPHLVPVGLHAHIGSQIFELAPFLETVRRLLHWAATMQDRHGFQLHEFSPGGGWGAPLRETDPPAPVDTYVRGVSQAVRTACCEGELALPTLILEPGRSIVGPAAMALYRIGTRKEIPGVRTYVSVDGGMADNIRPALYGARYTALVAGRAHQSGTETVTIAGRFCESGDVLIHDTSLPRLVPGDLLAIPGVGAYCLSLANNYNLALRPAVVMVREGQARLIQRRERLDDLLTRDLPLSET